MKTTKKNLFMIRKNQLRLDLGTGKGKTRPDGFIGVDKTKYEGVEHVVDLGQEKWPWQDESVDEVNSNYVLHHLTMPERVHFMNELFRVLKPEAKAVVIAPYWAAGKAYAEPATQWPPLTEPFFFYLSKQFREAQGYDVEGPTCDFDVTIGYGLHPSITPRAQEYQQHAVMHWKEAAQDIHVTLTKHRDPV